MIQVVALMVSWFRQLARVKAFLRVDLNTRSRTFLPIHASAGCAA